MAATVRANAFISTQAGVRSIAVEIPSHDDETPGPLAGFKIGTAVPKPAGVVAVATKCGAEETNEAASDSVGATGTASV